MKHMCRSCDKSFAECQSHPIFASETDDRVIDCDIYEESEDYGKMNTEDLLPIYNWRIVSNTLKGVDIVDAKAEKMLAALRRAVIKEASVGKIGVTFVEVRNPTFSEYSHIDPRMRVQWKENHLPYDAEKSDLLLIPVSKETP